MKKLTLPFEFVDDTLKEIKIRLSATNTKSKLSKYVDKFFDKLIVFLDRIYKGSTLLLFIVGLLSSLLIFLFYTY